jgi:hypothetical protein
MREVEPPRRLDVPILDNSLSLKVPTGTLVAVAGLKTLSRPSKP